LDSNILSFFTVPEKTRAGHSFAEPPLKISLDESNVVIYGVPLDITTSFGKGTSKGPEAIRLTSARQIETFVLDEKADIYELNAIFDLGDLNIPKTKDTSRILTFLDSTIPKIVSELRKDNKIPVMIGGEHTLSYYQLRALAKEKPVVIHFDAHRDMKPEYEGMKMCHTTPFYHLLKYIPGKNIIQIGIRQTDKTENETAVKNGVTTFDAWQVHNNITTVLSYLQDATKDRKIYISFDIDAYDIPYVPCTGTPEPFGLNPFDVLRMIKAIHSTARLIGIDMVEVSSRNKDYREGALATQTLFRIFARKYAR
jgi:agmatinase